MKRFLFITVLVCLAFWAEFVLYNILGPWGKPELMVLAIVFCNLYWGIRHSIWAAFTAGILKDAFGIEPFGTHLFVYTVAAYLTAFTRDAIYQPGSRFSRAVVAFFVLTGVFILEILLHMRFFEVRVEEAAAFIFVPRMVLTMATATFVFHRLRDTVVKFKL